MSNGNGGWDHYFYLNFNNSFVGQFEGGSGFAEYYNITYIDIEEYIQLGTNHIELTFEVYWQGMLGYINIYGDFNGLACTDPYACNYNPDATEDDGSCEYYDPEIMCDCDETFLDVNGDCCSELMMDDCWVCNGDGTSCDGVLNVPSEYSTIQSAIDAATEGDIVLVSPGTYIGQTIINTSNITLASHFINDNDSTFIESTKLINEDTVYDDDSIIKLNSDLSGITIKGFIIEGGNTIGGIDGGAVQITDNDNVLIDHCIFRNNSTEPSDEGSQNGYGGAILLKSSNATISNSVFENNSAKHGGAIALLNQWDGTLNLDNCVFDSNTTINTGGSDIYIWQGSVLAININNSKFLHSIEPIVNEMGGGSTTIDVFKTVFYDVDDIITLKNNSTTNATFTNCTLSTIGNPASSGGSGGGNLIAKNCIFYPYDGEGGYHMHDFFRGFSNYEVSYSLTYYSGDYNFVEDPQFVDFDNGDLHLQSTSPCIDYGDPESPLDPDGTRADMGALYYDQIENPINYGCIDPGAVNYDPDATIDDGSCYYMDDIQPHFEVAYSDFPSNPMGIYINSALIDGTVWWLGDEIAAFDGDVCVGVYTHDPAINSVPVIFASADDPATPEIDGFIPGHPVELRLWDATENIEIFNLNVNPEYFEYVEFGSQYVDVSVNVSIGCADMAACNYDPTANVMGDSCEYPEDMGWCDCAENILDDCGVCDGGNADMDECGVCFENNESCTGCTDNAANNYDPDATIDDGSCIYPDLGDMNNDGYINIMDLVLMANWILEDNEYVTYADISGDGQINIIDIVQLVNWILYGIQGCMEPDAINYNPDATIEGECHYPPDSIEIQQLYYEDGVMLTWDVSDLPSFHSMTIMRYDNADLSIDPIVLDIIYSIFDDEYVDGEASVEDARYYYSIQVEDIYGNTATSDPAYISFYDDIVYLGRENSWDGNLDIWKTEIDGYNAEILINADSFNYGINSISLSPNGDNLMIKVYPNDLYIGDVQTGSYYSISSNLGSNSQASSNIVWENNHTFYFHHSDGDNPNLFRYDINSDTLESISYSTDSCYDLCDSDNSLYYFSRDNEDDGYHSFNKYSNGGSAELLQFATDTYGPSGLKVLNDCSGFIFWSVSNQRDLHYFDLSSNEVTSINIAPYTDNPYFIKLFHINSDFVTDNQLFVGINDGAGSGFYGILDISNETIIDLGIEYNQSFGDLSVLNDHSRLALLISQTEINIYNNLGPTLTHQYTIEKDYLKYPQVINNRWLAE